MLQSVQGVYNFPDGKYHLEGGGGKESCFTFIPQILLLFCLLFLIYSIPHILVISCFLLK